MYKNVMNRKMTAVAVLVLLAVLSPTVSATPLDGFDGVDQQTTAAALPGLAINAMVFMAVGRTKKAVVQQTKAMLQEQANVLGIRTTSSMTKSQLETAIAEHTAAMEAIPPTGSGQVRRFDARDDINLPFQRAVEIRGKVQSVGHPNNGGIKIIDDEGTVHEARYNNWTALGQALERGLDGFYYSTWTPGGGKKAAVDTQNKMLQQANAIPMDKRPTVRFVVITHNGAESPLPHPILYSVVTDTYTSIASEDIYNRLIDVLPPEQYQYRLTGNDGVHAGALQITQRDSDSAGIFNWTINIDCGKFNGMNSIKVSGGMRVLFCSNQISLDVMSAARDLNLTIDVGQSNSLTRRHAGDLDSIIDEIVSVAGYSSGNGASDMVTAAMGTDLSEEEFCDVLDYYTDVKGLSSKVRDLAFDAWDNHNQTQIPETLYGAIMAITYAGTHTREMKDGVSRKLQVMGGELMAIAPHFDALLPTIVEKAAEARTKVETKAKTSKPWAVAGAEGLIKNRDGSVMGFKTIDHANNWISVNQPKDAPFQMTAQVWGILPPEPVAEEPSTDPIMGNADLA